MSPIVTVLIPVLVPMIVSQLKKLPMPTWVIPIMSMILGAATEVTAQLAGGAPITASMPVDGGVLGLAGVGIREVFDQIRKR